MGAYTFPADVIVDPKQPQKRILLLSSRHQLYLTNIEVEMDVVTILGIALIGMLPNIAFVITLWFGNRSNNVGGSNK